MKSVRDWAYGVMLLGVMACGSCVKRPEKVLSDKQMAPLVADYELARACGRADAAKSYAYSDEEALLFVLDKHGVSREAYDSTIAWYGRNPDKYYVLCEMVEKDLSKKQRNYAGKDSEVQTNDLWPYGRMLVFSDLSASDGLDFSVPVSELTPGERLLFKMRFSSRAEGAALVGVEYENGLKAYNTVNLSGRRLELDLQTDTAYEVRRIFGNVVLDEEVKLPVWADSISLNSLPFDSLEYYRINSQRVYRNPAPIVKKNTPKVNHEVQDSLPDPSH